MIKQNAFLKADAPQLSTLDAGKIFVKKQRKSLMAEVKSNLVLVALFVGALISVIVLSFKVHSHRLKANKIRADMDDLKKTYSKYDSSLKEKENELAQAKQKKWSVQLLFHQFYNDLIKASQELESSNNEKNKMLETIQKYQQEGPSKGIDVLKMENERLLKQLSELMLIHNGDKNPRMRNKVSELLSEEDIQLLEQWTGKKLLFACFNTHIHPMSGRQFHGQCNMFSGTVVVIELDSTIIGGYTSQDWKGNQDKYDDKAFVFNLKNKKKFNVRENHIAICPSELDLPVFSKDIALTKDIFYVQFPHSYGESYGDKEHFGIDSTLIQPKLIEVIVVH